MLARMCQLENKISAVGEPSYRLIAITSYISVSSITENNIFLRRRSTSMSSIFINCLAPLTLVLSEVTIITYLSLGLG